jgi:hypothetical protein
MAGLTLQGSATIAHGPAWEIGYDDGLAGAEQQKRFRHMGLDAEYAAGYEYGVLDRLAEEARREQAELRQWAQGG